ncbi:MAG: adenylyltransferase/cytidyltransferase family protein, partial [Planctomycetaceae bacterium]|nr:adenylyltransferase/cytidyltransferase family protein [Planctomycetaceae bacterium]
MSKVYPLSELSKQLAARKAAGSVVVHCHGVFDLLHIGHIRYLQKAKRLGDVLVVTLTADRFVNKGPHRPVFHQEYRADALAALDCVDYVAINEAPTAVTVLEKLQPDIYAKGAEFAENKTPELLQEETTMQKLGGRVEFIADVTSSSSFLLNNYLSPFSRETENYLKQLRETSSPGEILKPLQEARSAKVLVVGEAIIDEYCNCSASGMSSKAPVLVARFENQQRFAGGALAVANHLAGFCDEVTLCAMVGSYSSEEDWLRKQLRENVTAHFIPKPDSPTIVKRRYRESYFGVPL